MALEVFVRDPVAAIAKEQGTVVNATLDETSYVLPGRRVKSLPLAGCQPVILGLMGFRGWAL